MLTLIVGALLGAMLGVIVDRYCDDWRDRH